MKKLMTFLVFGILFATSAIWMMEGCVAKVPTLAKIVATSTPTLGPQWVSNFENAGAALNPNLYNSSNGLWSYLPAGNFISSPGYNGSNYAGNIKVAAAAVTGYSPYELTASPNGSGLYNLAGGPYGSPTNGIQFYWKVGPTDNMAARWFICPVPAQIPPPLGNCGGGAGCYATFKQDLNVFSGVPGTWTLVSFPWSSFSQPSWGVPQTGSLASTSLVTGTPNLSQIIYFQWEEDPNGAPTPTVMAADFWLDDVELF